MDTIKARPAVAATVGGIVGAGSLYLLWKWYSKRECIPTNWRAVGTLNDLMCFPIKSCGIIREKSMECTDIGLKSGQLFDREFMITDESGKFLTARAEPKIILIKPTINGDIMTLTAPQMEPVHINIGNLNGKTYKVNIWGSSMDAIDCGDEVSKWLSKYVFNRESGLRLAHRVPNCLQIKRSRIRSIVKDSDSGAFPDLTSYCLINESSIDDLNSRMNDFSTDAQTFRPNFVVKGAPPLEEDHWQWVKIGDVIFRVVKYCTRCILTTVDYKTGVKNANGEPLATLRKYRMIGVKPHDKGSPVMGIHLVLRKPGNVQLSDTVYVA